MTKLSVRGLFEPATTDLHHRFLRPTTFATYDLNWAIAGARPFGFHFFNVDFRRVYVAAELMRLGETDDALKFLDVEIANSPGFSLAWSSRALLRYQRREIMSAREDAQNALRLDPANIQAQYLLNSLGAPAPFSP